MPLFDTRDPNSTVHAEAAAEQVRRASAAGPLTQRQVFWAAMGALIAFHAALLILFLLIMFVREMMLPL